ncbi:MAG: PIN domain-containing protein [Verrucomicrobia bacterium]|nr:PIN domain-containing protein [Verrucomicrobiota bacterium]
MRVFLDANILFSGAQARSRMRAFLDLLFKHAECLSNAYAIEEARRNLELKTPTALRRFDFLVKRCELIPSILTELDVQLKSKDIPILGGAIVGNATHLLTGDERDFGAFFGKKIRGVKIVSPRLLADELKERGLL